jgi:Tol biopolymer transport system component
MSSATGSRRSASVLALSLGLGVSGVVPYGAASAAAQHARPNATATRSGVTVRVSVTSNEEQQVGESLNAPAISAHGRYVAFSANADLEPGGSGSYDIFLRDRRHGTTTRMSVNMSGAAGNGFSTLPAVSSHGRFVAFVSDASNLVPGDTNGAADVFVRDRRTGRTSRVSLTNDGTQISEGAALQAPAMSADGRFVAFSTGAANVAPGRDTNSSTDVFIRDRRNGTTRRVSLSSAEREGDSTSENAAISANGRYVAFSSRASNLVRGDTNEAEDVFLRDRLKGTTRRMSVSSAGRQASGFGPTLSPNGRYVGFTTDSDALVPGPAAGGFAGYARDRRTGTTRRVTVGSGGVPGNDNSSSPRFSAGGRYVAFSSFASNLVVDDTNGVSDVFVRDRRTGTTRRVSLSTAGAQGDGQSMDPALSTGGRHVAFNSDADDLVPGDTNFHVDTYVHDLHPRR